MLAKINSIYYNKGIKRGDNVDENLKRSIILEHYQHPMHRGLTNQEGYLKSNTNSDSCIDEIDLMVKIENDKIIDIRFDGEACAICTSSTSIMIDTLIGKSIEEVKNIYDNYTKMIEEKDFDSEILEQAIVYEDIYKQPNRKKCALLPWWGLEKIISSIEENVDNEKY